MLWQDSHRYTHNCFSTTIQTCWPDFDWSCQGTERSYFESCPVGEEAHPVGDQDPATWQSLEGLLALQNLPSVLHVENNISNTQDFHQQFNEMYSGKNISNPTEVVK